MKSKLNRACAVAALALLTAGCAGEGSVPPDGFTLPDFGLPDFQGPVPGYALQILGNPNIAVPQGTQVAMQVLYANHGVPLVGQPVYFAPSGSFADSTLNPYQSLTNANGVAQTTLVAGQAKTAFSVQAKADKTAAVSWNIQVTGNTQPPPLDLILHGQYAIHSKFDVQSDFAGTKVADVLNAINDITDEPEDPGKYLLDAIVDQLKISDSLLAAVIEQLKVALYADINNLLVGLAPNLINTIKQLGQNISAVARKFELKSTMMAKTEQSIKNPMVVDHLAEKLAWTLYNQTYEVAINSIGNETLPLAKNVSITPAALGENTISQHTFEFKYGLYLMAAINNLAVPLIKINGQSASSVSGLLALLIPCQKVADTISTQSGTGSNALVKAACDAVLSAAGLYVEDTVLNLGSTAMQLNITGSTKLVDTDNDKHVDLMPNGVWSGTFKLDTVVAPLAPNTNTFTGQLQP